MFYNPAAFIIEEYSKIFSTHAGTPADIGLTIPFPVFSATIIHQLCQLATKTFLSQPTVLTLEGEFVVIGDLHGNIRDLLRIIATLQPPPITKYIFLGDYVDRGEFSIETITILLAFAVQYPESVYVLRGNHEIACVNALYGFREQILATYGSCHLWEGFNQVFSCLPIAAILNHETFIVHGGLSPKLKNVQQLRAYSLPITEIDGLLSDVLWSDPSSAIDHYAESPRGTGCLFGPGAVKEFARFNGFTKIIRAHQCIEPGVSTFADGILYTVFSCSNYCSIQNNSCGIIRIKSNNSLIAFNLPLLTQIARVAAVFQRVERSIAQEPPDNISSSPDLAKPRKRKISSFVTKDMKKLSKKDNPNRLSNGGNTFSTKIAFNRASLPEEKQNDLLPKLSHAFN